MQHPHSHRLLAIPTDMCIVIRRVVLAAWLVSISGCANSQPVGLPSPSERSEPHEALAFYEGTWTRLDGKPEEDFERHAPGSRGVGVTWSAGRAGKPPTGPAKH